MTMIPKREAPDPLPKINPIWEFQAEGDLKQTYEAYKSAFQVPWVGVVSLAYAHYRHAFDCWWRGVEPLVQSKAYVEASFAARRHVEERVAALSPPPIVDRLKELGYSDRERAQIRDMIEFLSHGNFIQMAVFAFRLLLEGEELSGGGSAESYGKSHAVDASTPFVLMEPHHASPDIRAVYQDIMKRLNLPFVNTDYRALSRWPSYFALAWQDLRPHIGTSEHEALAQDMHDRIFNAVASLPNPGGLTADALKEAADRDASVDEVLQVSKLFTHLIPGLVVNVAFFRAQLRE